MAFTWADNTITTTGGKDFRDFAEDTVGAILCGVGGTGLVRTSANGTAWTDRTASEANNWRGVAFASTLGTVGRLVAVAIGGTHRVMYSDDHGATWTNATASEANQWNVVQWVPWLNGSAGLFVAMASTGTHRCMTSADGITWANQTVAGTAKGWIGLSFSATTLVAVAFASGTTQQVATSPDAVTWTLQTSSASSADQVGVAGGSSCLAYSSTLSMFAYVARVGVGTRFINTSTDNGVTWVSAALPTSRTWTGIRWLANSVNRFVVMAQSSTTRVASSTDGLTFTEEDTALSNQSWDCVGWLGSAKTLVSWGQSSSTHMLSGVWVDPPTVTSLTPASGTKRGGTVVTITGTHLTGTTGVTFGGTAAVSVVVGSDTSVTCVTPAHVGAIVDVAVTTPSGTATLTGAFTFLAVDHVSPRTGTVAGGTAVTITGFGFNAATGVLFDTAAATDVVLDPITPNLKLTAVTPAHASGLVDVTVSGVGIGTGLYTYTLPIPQNQGSGPLLPPIPTRRA